MKPYVAVLLRENFNGMSNRQLIASAVDRKAAIRLFFEGASINHPIVIRSSTLEGEKARYFRTTDFKNPRFVQAIEGYVIDGARSILELAPSRGITTAVNQIFGKGGLDLIEAGKMIVPERAPGFVTSPGEPHAATENSGIPLRNVLNFPLQAGLRHKG